MAIFLKNSWNVPPVRWGSFADVQYAVKVNSEKVYGVDPESYRLLTPYFWGLPIKDYSGNKEHGSNFGALSKDNSLYFDGTANINYTDIDLTQFTVRTILKTDVLSTWQNILGDTDIDDGSNLSYTLKRTNANAFRINAKTGSGSYVAYSTTSVATGKKYQIIATFDPSINRLRIFIDGVREGNVTTAGSLLQYNYITRVSYYITTDPQRFTGNIYDLSISTSVFTQEQVLRFQELPYGLYQKVARPLYLLPIGTEATKFYDLNTEISGGSESIQDLTTDIRAVSDGVYYDLTTDIRTNKRLFYDLQTEIAAVRSKYWLDTEIEALSYARWSFNTEWNPNRFLNTEIAAKKPYTFSFKTKTGSSYVASSSEIEILLSGYSWPLRTLFLDFLRIGTSNVYNFDIWFARGHSGKNPLRNAKIKAEYTNTQFANGYEVISCDWLSLKVGDGAYQTVNETPLLLGDMPCDSKLSVSLKVECRDCSLTRGLVYFKLVFSGDYTESVYNSIGYGDGAQYFSGDCDDYQSPSFICRLYVV